MSQVSFSPNSTSLGKIHLTNLFGTQESLISSFYIWLVNLFTSEIHESSQLAVIFSSSLTYIMIVSAR